MGAIYSVCTLTSNSFQVKRHLKGVCPASFSRNREYNIGLPNSFFSLKGLGPGVIR